MCLSQPINVGNNVSFLLDHSKFQNESDIVCDNMGVLLKPPTFPNAIPIILVKEVKFTNCNTYTIETHPVEMFARSCPLFMVRN